MKRSEMVMKVAYELIILKNQGKLPYTLDDMSALVLLIFEKNGMLPPSYYAGAPGDSMDCAGNNIEYDDVYLNEWEPEV